jgi:hypothetical protein
MKYAEQIVRVFATVNNHVILGQGTWVIPTSAICLVKEIICGWTVGRALSSPPFDFYSTIDRRCGLIWIQPGT